MRIVLSGGLRTVVWGVAMGAIAGAGFSGCAKRPSQDSAVERPPGFYLADAQAIESDETINFPVDLIGGAPQKVSIQFSVANWAKSDDDCQKIADVLPNGSGLPPDGRLKATQGIDCAVIQGSIPSHPYAGNIRGNVLNTDASKVPVPNDVFSQLVVFETGEVRKVVKVPLVHLNGGRSNGYYERDKQFFVRITSYDRDAPQIYNGEAKGLIKNVDPAPSVSLIWSNQGACSSSSCDVSEQTQPAKALSVIVNGQSDLPIRVPLKLEGTAKPWSDYIIFNGGGGLSGKDLPLANKLVQQDLIIPSFGTSTSAIIEVIDDAEEETAETIIISVPREALRTSNTQELTINKKIVAIQDIRLVDQSAAPPVVINVAASDPHSYTRRPVSPMLMTTCMQTKILNGQSSFDMRENSNCPSPDVPANGLSYSIAAFPGQDGLKSEAAVTYTLIDANGNTLWPRGTTEPVFDGYGQLTGVKLEDGTQTETACIKDNQTGLLWEAKNFHTAGSYKNPAQDSFSLHAYDLEFTVNSDINKQTPIACMEYGVPGRGGRTTHCAADYFVAEANHEHLCGKTGWRLPKIEELRGLVRYETVPRWDNPLVANPVHTKTSSIFFHDANFFWWLSDSAGIIATAFSGAYLSGETTHKHGDGSMADVGLGIIFKSEIFSPLPNLVQMSTGQVVLVHD